MRIRIAFLTTCVLACVVTHAKPLPTDLFLRGYSVLPSPKKVQLQADDLQFDGAWTYDAGRFAPNHIAVRALLADLKEFHRIEPKPAGAHAKNVIRLAVAPGAVAASDPDNGKQAYKLVISPGLVDITGNTDAGLFYGVQTFLQLLKPGPRGVLLMPACTIEDWPTYALRFLHWDTKHHQDRIETLKRYIDWAARFKANMIGFELEDKFEYPSHPVIGVPGAFTTAQLQEVVNYGLERFVQVVPQLQTPAHMTFVLKHPEFADLRCDGMNYQVCLCDERSYDLIFSMFDDLIKATKGIDYFFVSTDEVYYAGKCAKCEVPYNPENRSLKWAEFARRAHDYLQKRNRKMLAWIEYPFLTRHMDKLPPDLINGVLGSDREKIKAESARGIRQLIYVSTQGAEVLFPEHLNTARPQQLAWMLSPGGATEQGRLDSMFDTISHPAEEAQPIGVYAAAWDDSGLHSETFWLGWATVMQYGWAPGAAPVGQTVSDFMNLYYGPRVSGMADVYWGLQAQARFFQNSWDRTVSRVRGPGYGNPWPSDIVRMDRTLPPPPMPGMPGLEFAPVYVGRYEKLIEEARHMSLENEILSQRIQDNILKADRNRYNLEVFLSLAEFTAHHSRLLLAMKGIEDQLRAAHDAAVRNNPKLAVGQLVAAHDRVRRIVSDGQKAFADLTIVWEKSRFPKGQEVKGKKFLHVLDDVKDHWADRRPDLCYMTAPEDSIGLEQWLKNLSGVIEQYAKKNNVPVRGLEEEESEE